LIKVYSLPKKKKEFYFTLQNENYFLANLIHALYVNSAIISIYNLSRDTIFITNYNIYDSQSLFKVFFDSAM